MNTRNEKGQAIVILAIALVALLAFVALAIDGGNLYSARREAQNAADAAAMAGARQVALECGKLGQTPGPDESAVLNAVTTLAGANTKLAGPSSGGTGATFEAYYLDENGTRMSTQQIGVGGLPCGCPGRAQGVEVIIHNTARTFIAGIIGQPELAVGASAKARYGAVTTVSEGLYPLTRRNLPIAYNQTVTLRILDDADTLPGNFGWLTWDGQNNIPALAQSLVPPGNSYLYYNPGTPANNWTPNYNDHVINVGDWVQGAPGNKNSSQVRGNLNQYFMPTANPRHIMIIPLYDDVAGQGSHSNYRVASFAAFWLDDYDFTGQDKYATGRFVRWVTNGDWSSAVTCGVEGGVVSVKLSQ